MPDQKVLPDGTLQSLSDLTNAGDSASKEALLDHACDRLIWLASESFQCCDHLRRRNETSDVFRNSMLWLHNGSSAIRSIYR